MTAQRFFLLSVKILLFLTALTPLVVIDSLYFAPFVFGRVLFYRVIIEIALIIFAGYVVFLCVKNRDFFTAPFLKLFRDPIVLSVVVFFLSAGISTLLAPNVYRGFFGDMQRGEGFLGILHYLVFLLLALFLFKKKDWLFFFKILLGVGLISAFYAWLQYFGVQSFPLALSPEHQPGSFAGNSAFLASELVLLFGVAAIVFYNSSHIFWRYFALFASIIGFFTIFLTQIRGAILGMFSGVAVLLLYFLIRGVVGGSIPKKVVRIASGILFIILIGFSSLFWLTRTADMWLAIPGISRLTTISLNNPSVVTRLIALNISWEAFKERPIFGWGMENYNVAYNKHFDPSYSFYAEDWFDRAHNRIADIAVMQGSVGLVAYGSIFFFMFYFLWKSIRHRTRVSDDDNAEHLDLSSAAPFLGVAFIAYFVQNLFLFDQVISYILFFALVGVIIFARRRNREDDEHKKIACRPFIVIPAAIVLIIGLLTALYAYNYLPVYQSIQYRNAIQSRVGSKIADASEKFLKPYTFNQMELRGNFVELMYNSGLVVNEQFAPLVNIALDSLEEAVNKEPYDPRNFSRLIESYNERAKTDPSFFDRTETFALRAVELAPQRQGLLYHYAFTLAGQERYEEAITVAREALALDSRIAKSHYELAINLALAADSSKYKGTARQREYRGEAEKDLDLTHALGMNRLGTTEPYEGADISATQYYLFLESDLKNMVILYRSLGRPDGMANVLEILISFHPQKEDYYYDAIIVYRSLRNKEKIIEHAKALKKLDISFADDMDVIIDLAEKEAWNILDTL